MACFPVIIAVAALAAPVTAARVQAETLFLEVALNGRDTGLIVAVVRGPNGELAMAADDLTAMRIATPATGTVRLSDVDGLSH